MNYQKDKDYKVPFSGGNISKLEANRIGLSLIINIFIIFPVNYILKIENKYIVFFVCLISVLCTYFFISKLVFKKNRKKQK